MARVIVPHGPGVAAIVAALPGARYVGGCVRDALAGHDAKDIDLATPLTPEEVLERLSAQGIKVIPTGIAHGTITAVSAGEGVEVTTLRRDVSTDGRRATIAFTDDWREDASRRDFTINSLYADTVSGEVVDYFGGVSDLETGLVRFIGEPLQRIAEDHLRILRFFRFHARFGKAGPDPASLEACKVRANDLMALSRERIALELLAILALPEPSPIIGLMIECGIFAPVLPEIDQSDALAELVRVETEMKVAADPIRRLAALLPAHPTIAEDVAGRLKLSNAQKKRLTGDAARVQADAQTPKALAYTLGLEIAIDRLLLLSAQSIEKITGWKPPQFSLSGGEIIARGIVAGPDVARIRKQVEERWISEDFPDHTRCLGILDEILGSR